MRQTKHGEIIYSEDDLVHLVMQGREVLSWDSVLVDHTVNITSVTDQLEVVPNFVQYSVDQDDLTTEEFDRNRQQTWFMPQAYRDMDIAEHVLSLCTNDAELQRCGQELLMYQERGLFDLLRYLKYLVDTMREHNLIWGVGRGSSVASYVLYKLGVHKIDSMHYDLDPQEFLR